MQAVLGYHNSLLDMHSDIDKCERTPSGPTEREMRSVHGHSSRSEYTASGPVRGALYAWGYGPGENGIPVRIHVQGSIKYMHFVYG